MYAEFDESPSHNPKSLILSPFFNKSKLTKEQIAEFEEKAATIEENQVSTIFKKFSRSQSIEKFKTFVNWVESKKPFSTRKIYDDIKLLKFLGHSDFESVLNESNIVSCIALSPNESYLAIGSDLAPIHLWDLTTKNSLGFLGFKEKIDKINSLVMTDFFLFSAGWDKTIRKWDLITRTLEKSYEGHEAPILCLEITKDQNYLLSGSEDRAIIIWDLYTDLKRKIPAHLSPVSCVKANPLTDSIISASWDKTIKIWSFHTIKLKAILLGHTDAIKALAVSPSGKLLASAGKDKLIKIWDLETNKLKNCLEGHQKTINVLRFSLYGDFLISGSNDKTMKLWNMNKFKLKKTIEGHTKDITGVWILSDDKKLVSASLDMTVKVWPLESSSNKIENKVEISILAIFPLQRKVLTYGNDEMIQIWDIESGKQTASIYEENGPITAVCIDSIWKTIILGDAEGFLTLRAFLSYFKLVRKASHNKEVIGIRVLRLSNSIVSLGKDDCLNIWTNNLEKQLYSFNLSIYGRATTLETTILDQKDIILVGVKDKTCDILVWDLVEQKKTMSLKGHTEEITSIRITKLFGKVVSGSLDKTIRVWSLKTQAQLLCINTDHETFCLEITKNELTIVSTQKDCRIRLFELETGKQTGITNKYPHQTTPMALTPDSTMVILGGRSSSSSLKKVFLNKIKSKLILPTQKPVKLLTLSPNSEYLAASDSIIIYLWQLSTPTDPPEILQGHLKPIKGVIFTKDSQSKSILISGDEDFNIKVWDLPSGSLKFAIKEPLEGLSGLFIRENSDKILVVSHDKILRVLNIEKRTFDQVFQFTTCIIKLVVSHNGNRLYAGDSLGTIFELDIEGTFKKLRQTLKDLGKIEALAITHDDQKLYSSCSGSNFIKLWGLDSKELKLLATITGHSARVHSLIINKESNRLFSGSADKKICLWDIAQNKRIAELEGHGNLINGLALSIDEKTLFSGSEDRTVRGWNIEDCRQMSFICGHTTKVLKLAVNESGNLLASGDESGTVILWDLSKNQRKCSIDPLNDSPIQGLAFSYLINKDQLIISYQTDKGALFTLQQESLTQTSLFEYRTKVPATTIVITKDQMKVVLGFTDGTIRIWGLEALDNIERVIEGDKGSILALIVDKEGKRIIGGGKKGYIIIWEFINGKEMTRLKGHKVLRVLELENNEMRLFSGGDEGEVIIWDYKKLAILNRIDGMKWKGMITCMKASVDGKKLFVTCNNDNTIENIINNYNNNPSEVDEQEQSFLHIFSLETYHSIPNATLVYPSTDIVLSSNSNLLIYCFGTSIQVLQYPSLLPITLFSGQLSSLTAETLSPNHEFLVLADKENRITVWNMKTQMGLIEFRGHTNSISFLIVTSKNMIISASSDNTIRIWSIEERRLIDKLESHNAYINAMVISKNEELLLSTSAGTGIILWDLKTRKQLKHFLTSETFIYGLYISSDQTYFLSVGDKAVLNLWDLNDEYKKPRVLAIFEGSIIKMKISPDQKILLVFIAYPTEKIQFWETDSYTLVNEIEYDVQSSMPVFLTGKYNRLIFLGDKLIDCFTGRVIFTFTPKEKIMSFFYDYTNSSYFFISIEFKLYQINEDWLATYLYNYLNSDGVQNLRKEVSHICDRDYSIFPYFFSFLHLISIYDQNQDFTLERMKSVMRKGEADLFGVFYSLDIFLNTPLDILIQRKNPSLVIKYFDMLFKCIKEVDFYQKVRFFHYAFRDNYTILDLLCDLLKLIGSNISSIGKLLDEAFLPLPLSIYDNLLIYKEFNEPLLIETDSLYMNREFIEEKLKENDKNRDKTGEENHCLVKAKILCVPGIFDLNLERTREFYGLISNIEMDNDILMNKTFEMLVNFIWDRKVFYFYRIDFFVFLFFFLIFNINFAFLSQFRFEANSPNIFKFTSFILDLLLFFYSIFTLINESRQLLYNKWNYFKSFWNFIDIALIPLLMTSSLLDISLLINEYIEGIAYYQLLFSLCIGSLWFRLLSFSRGVKEMSSMIRLIFNVISGVRYFVLFMVLFMLALSSSLFLIRSHTSYENSFWETFLIFYDSAVGDTSGISSYEVVFSNFEEYYMILASFLFAIISVNLLVSIIGDKHNENKENEVKTRTYELLNIIVDNETSLVSQIVKRIKGPQHNSRFLLCLYNEKHERVEVVGIENEIEKLGKELQEHKDWIEGEIEKGVQRIEKEVRKGHEDNQNFIRI